MASNCGSRTRTVVLCIAAGVLCAVVAVATALHTGTSAARDYHQETVSVPVPVSCNDTSASTVSQTFFAVQFSLYVYSSCGPGGTVLNGTVTLANGSVFQFVLSGSPGSSQFVSWYSPYHSCGVEWNRGSIAILLVMA